MTQFQFWANPSNSKKLLVTADASEITTNGKLNMAKTKEVIAKGGASLSFGIFCACASLDKVDLGESQPTPVACGDETREEKERPAIGGVTRREVSAV